MLKRFGPRSDEVTGGWRKLHVEGVHKFCSSPSIIRMIKSRRMKLTRYVVQMGGSWNAYGLLVGMPGRNRPLRRPRQY
jgi:hypothetical protein